MKSPTRGHRKLSHKISNVTTSGPVSKTERYKLVFDSDQRKIYLFPNRCRPQGVFAKPRNVGSFLLVTNWRPPQTWQVKEPELKDHLHGEHDSGRQAVSASLALS